ncbi:MAG: bile acid:sodium symporter family protein [Saprospirales bacterium]|nr:MAG: bile acid:sodium symporter family protein [Saprospirales bacterium]
MHSIDDITINFSSDQLLLLNICLGFIMFSISLNLKLKDFKRLVMYPKSSIVGLSSQLILLPIFTIILISMWDVAASVALGLILVSCCPGGNISNFSVHLSGGNTALSITLTSIVTMFAVVITPLTFQFWASWLPQTSSLLQAVEVEAGSMLLSIAYLVLIPLLFGMYLSHRYPHFASKIRKPLQTLALLVFIAIILVAVYGNRDDLAYYFKLVFLLVLVHNGGALLIGYYFARANKLSLADAKAISFETGIQNAGLGLVLVFNFFEGLGGMMLVMAWWGIWDMISALLLAGYWRSRLSEKSS